MQSTVCWFEATCALRKAKTVGRCVVETAFYTVGSGESHLGSKAVWLEAHYLPYLIPSFRINGASAALYDFMVFTGTNVLLTTFPFRLLRLRLFCHSP
jgi:hypothetical protein